MAANAEASRYQGSLLGSWARTSAECKRPELQAEQAKFSIHMDADGKPTNFEYKSAHYETSEQGVNVKLGSRHPYGKTPSKEALFFKVLTKDLIALQQKNNRSTQFIRCAG